MSVRPERPPTGDLTVTQTSYEVRLADPFHASYARSKIGEMLDALRSLEARADGKVRIATSVDEIETASRAGSFAIVLHAIVISASYATWFSCCAAMVTRLRGLQGVIGRLGSQLLRP